MDSKNEQKKFLLTEDFNSNGRTINLSGMVDFEIKKAMTSDEFERKFVEGGKHLIFTRQGIAKMQEDIQKSIKTNIEKGENADNFKEPLANLNALLGKMQKISYAPWNANGRCLDVFVIEKSEVDDFSKTIEKSEENDIEKGIANDITGYGDSKIDFNKTGAEIKGKIGSVRDSLVAQQVVLQQQQAKFLEDAGSLQPNEPIDNWYLNGLPADIQTTFAELKKFGWDCCYAKSEDGNKMTANFSNQATTQITKEIANACQKYNDTIYKQIEIIKDLQKLRILDDNLEDEKSYKLSLEQLSSLGF